MFIRPRDFSSTSAKASDFDIHEHPAERSDAPVEIRAFGTLEVGEEAADPGRQVFFEQLTVARPPAPEIGRRRGRP